MSRTASEKKDATEKKAAAEAKAAAEKKAADEKVAAEAKTAATKAAAAKTAADEKVAKTAKSSRWGDDDDDDEGAAGGGEGLERSNSNTMQKIMAELAAQKEKAACTDGEPRIGAVRRGSAADVMKPLEEQHHEEGEAAPTATPTEGLEYLPSLYGCRSVEV